MRKYINDTDKTAKPTTEIIYGIDYVVGTLLKVISNAGHRVDVCVDRTRSVFLSILILSTFCSCSSNNVSNVSGLLFTPYFFAGFLYAKSTKAQILTVGTIFVMLMVVFLFSRQPR